MSSKLTIHFEGYWQCRQATDPDPSRDKRGASGYTFAIGNENDLDEIIRLQRDDAKEVERGIEAEAPVVVDHLDPGPGFEVQDLQDRN